MIKITDIKNYWDNHPLYSYEIIYRPGTSDFFKEADRVRWNEVDRFSKAYWDFPNFLEGKSILDIGCGPGVLSRFYASKKYKVTAIDLSKKAVMLVRKSLQLYCLQANVLQANAECLPFKDVSFDYIVSSGVLHHTVDTKKSVLEAYRVLKPGGIAKITLYYKNILLRKPFWHLTKFFVKKMCKAIPGRDNLFSAQNPDEFIKFYDGDMNPVGKGYTLDEARQLLSGPFTWLDHEIHFFPARFVFRWLPMRRFIHRYLDGSVGTMIYVNLFKGNA